MYNHYNYLIPENRQAWRSASEIAMVALAHENRRLTFMDQVESPMQPSETHKRSFLDYLAVPLQMLSSLLG